MKLFITRHGETDFNVQRRYAGQADVPLNETGVCQARELAEVLATESFDVIITSPLTRARQTAEAVRQYHPETPLAVMPEFAERHLGVYEGLTGQEAQQCYPDLWARYCTRQTDDAPTGGETVRQCDDRVAAGLAKLRATCGDKQVLLICHGFVSKAIHRQLGGLSYEEMYAFNLANCQVAVYDL
ncbi:MAG: histidine phosphatase family protein [Clostridiales bacterium]|nr:histidine phosphatase family protein [Clostridiales bacterium]